MSGAEVGRCVIDVLEAARDPETGERIIERAYLREDVYDGSELHRIPDVLIDFGERPYTASDRLAAGGIVERIPDAAGGGRHRRTGIILALGPGIEAGELTGARIVDVAPTALHAMGLAVPDDMDGRVLTELFSDGREVRTRGRARPRRRAGGRLHRGGGGRHRAVPQEPRLHLKERGLTPFFQAGGSFCTLCSVA